MYWSALAALHWLIPWIYPFGYIILFEKKGVTVICIGPPYPHWSILSMYAFGYRVFIGENKRVNLGCVELPYVQ